VQNVTPKDESVFDEKLTTKETLPSHTLGIFKHEFGSDGKIKSTWFLRQFSKDEAARKVTVSSQRHGFMSRLPHVVKAVSCYSRCNMLSSGQHADQAATCKCIKTNRVRTHTHYMLSRHSHKLHNNNMLVCH